MPPVCDSSWRRLGVPSPFGSVQLVSALSMPASRASLPCSTMRSAAMADTGLLSEAAWNSVCGVTAGPPVQATP